jgi:hypothetical protein
MKSSFVLAITFLLIALSVAIVSGQGIGSAEPPFTPATSKIAVKLLNNGEKRCDMAQDLADKSGMNYRLLGMKIMEQWQNSIRKDRTFIRNLQQYKFVEFGVKEDGTITIQGVEPVKTTKQTKKS